MSGEDIIKLNVGGKSFVTKRRTLCSYSGSLLASMFQEDSGFGPLATTEDGEIFLDRDPRTFDFILNFLRDGCHVVEDPPKELVARLKADADYFGLQTLVKYCTELSRGFKRTKPRHYVHYGQTRNDETQRHSHNFRKQQMWHDE